MLETEMYAATPKPISTRWEEYFEPFRQKIVGYDQTFDTPYGNKRILYADWIASGRLYAPIEEKIWKTFGPFVGNTHTETTVTGTAMTKAYHVAHKIIKDHVHAGPNDVLLTCGTGMTGAINKFQRILGLRVPDSVIDSMQVPLVERPVVFITHMEHHSNQTSWLECLVDVVVLEPDEQGLVNPDSLRQILPQYADRKLKIGAFTACSNVTGIETPYHELARIMHEHDGCCFVDFAMSAPYVDIDMHPADPMERLDAIFFSPHKFLGGPGSSGVLIFDASHYKSRVPDHPGGGTVLWTNPWGVHHYSDNIELREDGGTPGFLQAIRAALAIELKERMGTQALHEREVELVAEAFRRLKRIPGLHLLAGHIEDRLGALSFYLEDLHFNLVVKLLNDRYGIQTRGGCSCAGTYGHYLLHLDPQRSEHIYELIDQGDLSEKPGWVRLSVHPTMTDKELEITCDAIAEIAKHGAEWASDYAYSCETNEYVHKNEADLEKRVTSWFAFD